MGKARIYRPTKTAMQSGKALTQKWVLEFVPERPLYQESVMGWTGMRDTSRQIKLFFETAQEAQRYAEAHHLPYEILVKPSSCL